jgi:hypothetical protein
LSEENYPKVNLYKITIKSERLVMGMQTASDSLVSQDDKTASGDKNLDICPTLVNFIATLGNDLLPLTISWMKKTLIHLWIMRLSQ